MNSQRKLFAPLAVMAAYVFIVGCVTTDQQTSDQPRTDKRAGVVRPPVGDPQPSKVRFSEFSGVEMKHVTIAPEYASGNQRATKKIDEELFAKMRAVFPGLQDAGAVANQVAAGARILLIEPQIEGLRFISGGARFWVGAMAGNSAVRMKVTYKDKGSGEIIADPVFYRQSNAWAGGMSVGAADNAMLREIAENAAGYTILNR